MKSKYKPRLDSQTSTVYFPLYTDAVRNIEKPQIHIGSAVFRQPKIGLEPTTPSLRVKCSTN